jgi:septum formation protein
MTSADPSGSSSRPHLILASGSPRRRELLEGLGLTFTVRPADVDETPHPGEDPVAYVERLAREKAEWQAAPGELVLAADTTVFLGSEILGKPEDPSDAHRMLRALSGRTHEVATGVAVHHPPSATTPARTLSTVERTTVTFATLTDEEITWYIATNEPMDKAGAYAIQGLGGLFVPRIEGSYSNVVGLPVSVVYGLLGEVGFGVLNGRS